MSTAIELNRVSKKYILRHQRPTKLKEAVPLFLSRLMGQDTFATEEFWALKDVSFSLEEGEALGIIGPNGAGKSTILKLLSGITLPTKGEVHVEGKVAALIEVGAGFHPDLTGRENVILNGSIMGLKRKEIEEKFDSIVEFAELEQFIDTPVKRYSSGMFVRLGFAVAAHIEPDILLVDEVLAVGDMSFQKRCLARVNEIKRRGKTIIFVAHNLPILQELCDRVIWMEDGRIKQEGPSYKVIGAYTDDAYIKIAQKKRMVEAISEERWGSGEARIHKVRILDGEGVERDTFTAGESLRVEIHYEAFETISQPHFWVAIMNDTGLKITGSVRRPKSSILPVGKGVIECNFETLALFPGNYQLIVGIFDEILSQPYDRWGRVVTFTVVSPEDEFRTGIHNPDFYGVTYMKNRWKEQAGVGEK